MPPLPEVIILVLVPFALLFSHWAWLHGSLAPRVGIFTLTAFLPSSPRRHNHEIINDSNT